MRITAALVLLIAGTTMVALAGPPGFGASVPEIDPGSAVSVVALLTSGLLMFRKRSNKR